MRLCPGRALAAVSFSAALMFGGALGLARVVGSIEPEQPPALPRRGISLAVAGSGVAAALDVRAELDQVQRSNDGRRLGFVIQGDVDSMISDPLRCRYSVVVERNGAFDPAWAPAEPWPEPMLGSFNVELGSTGHASGRRLVCTGTPPEPHDELAVVLRVEVAGIEASDREQAAWIE